MRDGTGEPGYVIPDEIWEGAKHDRAGLLCMASAASCNPVIQPSVWAANFSTAAGGSAIWGFRQGDAVMVFGLAN